MIGDYVKLWRRALAGKTAETRFEARGQILMTHAAALVFATWIVLMIKIATRAAR